MKNHWGTAKYYLCNIRIFDLSLDSLVVIFEWNTGVVKREPTDCDVA